MKKYLLHFTSSLLLLVQISFAQSNSKFSFPQFNSHQAAVSATEKPVLQRNCGTMQNLEMLMKQDPTLKQRMEKQEEETQKQIQFLQNPANKAKQLYKIPVVVHVVYRTATQNISDAQIISQIVALNRDYRKQNQDVSQVPAAFASLAADVEIEFCLASVDTNGQATSGITRTSTTLVGGFSSSTNNVKSAATGGKGAWNTAKYLNIWVCELQSSLLGYAQFPNGPASTDGVVITYTGFGTIGTASFPYNLGRTLTHEVGHYLNLKHVWGDSFCGDDNITDTPPQQDPNFGCPNFPHITTCSNSPNGDMFMNYMDYVDDRCMFMFTDKQKIRMIAALTGSRASLLTNTNYNCSLTNPVITCDTLSNFSATDHANLYLPTDVDTSFLETGFITGTNSTNDRAKAEKFAPLTGLQKIFGVYIYFGATHSSSSTFDVRIWNSNGVAGSPGGALATKSITYSSIQADVIAGVPTYIAFTQPVTIPANVAYYVGIEFSPTGGDIAVLSNAFGETSPGTAWEKFSNSTWHAFTETSSWNVDLSLLIAPVACVDYTGINESIDISDGVQIYPNPSTGVFTLKSAEINNEKIHLKIYSILGAVVLDEKSITISGNQLSFDLSSHPEGLYFVELKTESYSVLKKINLIH